MSLVALVPPDKAGFNPTERSATNNEYLDFMSIRSKSLVALGAGFMVLLVGGGSRFAIGLTLKPMAEDLGWNRGTLGLAAGAFLVVSAGCMFLSGRLVDRLSLRLVLSGGLVLSALGIGLISVINEPWQAVLLYGGLFAIGSGLASITPIGVMVTRFFPDRAGLANAVAISGMGVGQFIIIAGLATVLVDIGWRSVYAWLGIINLLLLPLVLLGITAKPASTESRPVETTPSLTLREAARTSHFRRLIIVYATCGVQDFFVATHVVAFAQDSGASTLFAGNILALMGLTGLLGVIFSGWWCDRATPLPPMRFCFALRIGIFSLILLDQQIPSIVIFALLFGTTFWMTAPLTVIFARRAFGTAHLGALSGVIVMVHHICGGMGAYLGALLFDWRGSYHWAFVAMVALSGLGLLLSFGLRGTQR